MRVCDAQSRVDDTIAIAALIQAIVAKLHKLQRQNLTFRIYRRRLLDENRWRACRYGLDGKLIDFGAREEVEERSCCTRCSISSPRRSTNSAARKEVAHIENILREGSGADRQLAVWARTHDMRAVVDHIVAETYAGLTVHRAPRRLPDDARPGRAGISRQRPRRFADYCARFCPRPSLFPSCPCPTALRSTSIDPELLPGAHNAIHACLRLQPEERITIITDEASQEIAAALRARGRSKTARSTAFSSWSATPRVR